MSHIIPTVFAYNKKEFNERFLKLIKISKNIHIDFMDGKFVKSRGVNLKNMPNLKIYKISFEAHLMCIKPEKYVNDLKKKGFKKIIFHYEAIKKKYKILKFISNVRNNGLKAIIAINPNTKVEKIKNFLNNVDGALVMGVNPGKEHQKFNIRVYNKIKRLKKFDKRIKVQVDGGVNLEIARKLKKIGVDYINSGSFVSDAEEPKKVLGELEGVFR